MDVFYYPVPFIDYKGNREADAGVLSKHGVILPKMRRFRIKCCRQLITAGINTFLARNVPWHFTINGSNSIKRKHYTASVNHVREDLVLNTE